MIVDDAVVVRGLFSRWVEAEPDLEVVASLRTGREAVAQIERADPDVVVLDVDMPELDGIAALPLLLEKKRDLVVIMASTLTRRNAEISLRALSLGAADYIPKPDSNREVTGSRQFPPRPDRENPPARLARETLAAGQTVPRLAGAPAANRAAAASRARQAPPSRRSRCAPCRSTPPRVLLIGSSTGGPQALNAMIAQIGSVLDRAPVLITQHMPPTFTDHSGRASGARLATARCARRWRARRSMPAPIYLAPGGKHMSVARRDGARRDRARRRPADQFLQAGGRSAVYLGRRGLGPEGAGAWCSPAWAPTACAARRRSSRPAARVMAQDEATSVVWGMPGQVAHAGLCSAVLPLNDIAPRLTRLFAGDSA